MCVSLYVPNIQFSCCTFHILLLIDDHVLICRADDKYVYWHILEWIDPLSGAIELKILEKCMAPSKNMFFTVLRHFVFISRVLKCSERSHFCTYFPDKFIKENSWKYKGNIHIFVFHFFGMKTNFWVTLKSGAE